MELKDSGARRQFESGAVRDIADGKGRCDLLPLDVIGEYFDDSILVEMNRFRFSGDVRYLWQALMWFREIKFWGLYTMLLEVSKQYEDGARKYSDDNWRKGIPLHCYVDSAIRHYLKFRRGDDDEPHDRAFVWNILGAIWTIKNLPEMNDLPVIKKQETEKETNEVW